MVPRRVPGVACQVSGARWCVLGDGCRRDASAGDARLSLCRGRLTAQALSPLRRPGRSAAQPTGTGEVVPRPPLLRICEAGSDLDVGEAVVHQVQTQFPFGVSGCWPGAARAAPARPSEGRPRTDLTSGRRRSGRPRKGEADRVRERRTCPVDRGVGIEFATRIDICYAKGKGMFNSFRYHSRIVAILRCQVHTWHFFSAHFLGGIEFPLDRPADGVRPGTDVVPGLTSRGRMCGSRSPQDRRTTKSCQCTPARLSWRRRPFHTGWLEVSCSALSADAPPALSPM